MTDPTNGSEAGPRWLEEIDLVLDDEAGADGARLVAELEEDPEARALLNSARAIEGALKLALEEAEPPPGMWQRFEARMADEPPPRITIGDRLQRGLAAFLRAPRGQWAATGTAFLFLITCGTLWWDGSANYLPPPARGVELRPMDRAFQSYLSDELERQSFDALDELMIDYTTESILRGPAAPASGTPSEGEDR